MLLGDFSVNAVPNEHYDKTMQCVYRETCSGLSVELQLHPFIPQV